MRPEGAEAKGPEEKQVRGGLGAAGARQGAGPGPGRARTRGAARTGAGISF